MTNESRQQQAAEFAGAIFARREKILDCWLSLIEYDPDEPAATFIHDQLDATILALAGWILDEDPVGSTMAMQWIGIRPTRELIASAVVAMSLLPESVRQALNENPDIDLEAMIPSVAGFSAEVTTRVLRAARLDFNEERWQDVACEIEARYEAQRVQRIRRLSVLIEIAHAVSTSNDLDSLFEHVHQAATRLAGSDYTEISLFDSFANKLRCHLVYSGGARRDDLEQTLIDHGLANEVLRQGRELAFSDYATACQERGIPLSHAIDDGQQRAWMGAPMLLGDQIVGVIAVSCPMTSFDREDVELLAAVARQTAVALENRRLIEAQKRHVVQLSAVNHLSHEIAHLRDPDQLLTTATDLVHDFFDRGLVTIFLTDHESEILQMHTRAPSEVPVRRELSIPIAPGTIVGEVARSGRPVRYDDIRDGVEHLVTPETSSTRSEMAAPVIYSGRLLGVLDVQSPNIAAFDEHDLTTLHTIADQIATGLENSRLFADEAQRSRELGLMLQTTRAASSSLQLDEVLERLAEGIAEAAGTSSCLIHLYDVEQQSFRPSVMVGAEKAVPRCVYDDWNRVLSIQECRDLKQILNDPFPLIACPLEPTHDACRRVATSLLVPLRTRQRTLGMAIVAGDTRTAGGYSLDQMRLIQGVADSAALAVENARLYARAHGLAIAEERARLAQEIHDTLAQGLTAISLQLDLADSYLPAKPEVAAKNVQRALELSRQNLDEARRSVLDLRAADVHHMSLPDAISQLLRRLSEQSRITYEFGNEGLSRRLSARIEVGLYRILEEAVENARRHSEATHVRVTVRANGETVALVVEDDGHGFDPSSQAQASSGPSGFGLVGIRERARLLGGTLTISSNPGIGTSLRVTIPYEARTRPAVPVSADQGDTE